MIRNLLRPHILSLSSYSSARDEYSESEGIFLDANENPLGSVASKPCNRYPDPQQHKVKNLLALVKGVSTDNIFLGNGSDEAIDLLIRAFCEPHQDNIVILPPTYGMYEVNACISAVEVIKVPLNEHFDINLPQFWASITPKSKIVFLCSPNNPSGNILSPDSIKEILEKFKGMVVIDEAYIDFCPKNTFLPLLKKYPRLVIIQTFSKAWGLAGLRLGMAFGSQELIGILNKIKPPYNINQYTQEIVEKSLQNEPLKNEWVEEILKNKNILAGKLSKLRFVEKVFASEANFLLIKMQDSQRVFDYLLYEKVIVRNRNSVVAGCLRISVGTAAENKILLEKLSDYQNIHY